jgi:lycopene beta-cyclase
MPHQKLYDRLPVEFELNETFMTNTGQTADIILIGMGLQTGLILAAIAKLPHRPRVVVISPERQNAGSHTWSLHRSDLTAFMQDAVSPMVTKAFDSQTVKFPGHERTIKEPYWVTTTASIGQHTDCLEQQGLFSRINAHATTICDNVVTFDSGTIAAPIVLDNRGMMQQLPMRASGWQKFLGLEIELTSPVDLNIPIIMDATVDQLDGYRFMYVLPLSPKRLLVEDTYYSDSPDIDQAALEKRVKNYCEENGFEMARVIRKEVGALPIPLTRPNRNPPMHKSISGVVIEGGYRGEWYHRTTGYSFPVAAKLAETIAKHFGHSNFSSKVTDLWKHHVQQSQATTLLNNLLFRHFALDMRWNSLARFYKLPEEILQRFYAENMRPMDWFRLIVGKPPQGFKFIPRRHTCQTPST